MIFLLNATARLAGKVQGVVVHIGMNTSNSSFIFLYEDRKFLFIILKFTQTAEDIISLYSTSASANAEEDSIHQ